MSASASSSAPKVAALSSGERTPRPSALRMSPPCSAAASSVFISQVLPGTAGFLAVSLRARPFRPSLSGSGAGLGASGGAIFCVLRA